MEPSSGGGGACRRRAVGAAQPASARAAYRDGLVQAGVLLKGTHHRSTPACVSAGEEGSSRSSWRGLPAGRRQADGGYLQRGPGAAKHLRMSQLPTHPTSSNAASCQPGWSGWCQAATAASVVFEAPQSPHHTHPALQQRLPMAGSQRGVPEGWTAPNRVPAALESRSNIRAAEREAEASGGVQRSTKRGLYSSLYSPGPPACYRPCGPLAACLGFSDLALSLSAVFREERGNLGLPVPPPAPSPSCKRCHGGAGTYSRAPGQCRGAGAAAGRGKSPCCTVLLPGAAPRSVSCLGAPGALPARGVPERGAPNACHMLPPLIWPPHAPARSTRRPPALAPRPTTWWRRTRRATRAWWAWCSTSQPAAGRWAGAAAPSSRPCWWAASCWALTP